MNYDRIVLGYHGCDQAVAQRLFDGQPFQESANDYDWLGRGVYFWEYGLDRALQFAHDQQRRGKVVRPAVVGALLQLANCFDLMDTASTHELGQAFPLWARGIEAAGASLPRNAGASRDRLLRRRDCALINWYLDRLGEDRKTYDTVRCGFVEGGAAFPDSGISVQSHVQIAVRNPSCIVGVFRPRMVKHGA